MTFSAKSIALSRHRHFFSAVAALILCSSVHGFTFSAPNPPRVSSSHRNYDVTGIDHSIHKSGSTTWSPQNKGEQAALSVSTFQPQTTGSYISGPLQPTLSATKGFVFTTLHASTSAATSSVVRNTVKLALTIVPTWVSLKRVICTWCPWNLFLTAGCHVDF
jgi:hypothetical protein